MSSLGISCFVNLFLKPLLRVLSGKPGISFGLLVSGDTKAVREERMRTRLQGKPLQKCLGVESCIP
jgi:hypothetical protein